LRYDIVGQLVELSGQLLTQGHRRHPALLLTLCDASRPTVEKASNSAFYFGISVQTNSELIRRLRREWTRRHLDAPNAPPQERSGQHTARQRQPQREQRHGVVTPAGDDETLVAVHRSTPSGQAECPGGQNRLQN
jgi:hypothetical protein